MGRNKSKDKSCENPAVCAITNRETPGNYVFFISVDFPTKHAFLPIPSEEEKMVVVGFFGYLLENKQSHCNPLLPRTVVHQTWEVSGGRQQPNYRQCIISGSTAPQWIIKGILIALRCCQDRLLNLGSVPAPEDWGDGGMGWAGTGGGTWGVAWEVWDITSVSHCYHSRQYKRKSSQKTWSLPGADSRQDKMSVSTNRFT